MRHNHLHNTINSKRIGLELLHERGLFHIKKQNKNKNTYLWPHDTNTITVTKEHENTHNLWQKNMKIPTIFTHNKICKHGHSEENNWETF